MKDTGEDAGRVVVIFGGRSEIGVELARRLAPGATMILTTRHGHSLDQQVRDLRAAGATAVHVKAFDADDLTSHGPVLAEISTEHGPIDTAVLAFGILGDQRRAETDADHAVAMNTDLRRAGQSADPAGRRYARCGPRADRGVLLGGGYPGAPRQLRVRIGQGQPGSTVSRAGWPMPCTEPGCTC